MKAKLIFIVIALCSCEASEIPQPMKFTKLTRVYTIQPLVGSSFNPTYLTNLNNGK
jgi:hypothetical protein